MKKIAFVALFALVLAGCGGPDPKTKEGRDQYKADLQEAKTIKEKFEVLEDYCGYGFSEACMDASKAVLKVMVDEKSTKEEHAKAIRRETDFLLKACDLDEPRGCSGVGHAYSGRYEKDIDKAIKYYKKACELDERHCYKVAEIYLGESDDHKDYKDIKKAAEYYDKSCKLDLTYCKVLSNLYIGKDRWGNDKYTEYKNLDLFAKYYLIVNPKDGAKVGELFYENNESEKGDKYMDQACNNDVNSCKNVAYFYSRNGNVDKYATYLEKYCLAEGRGSISIRCIFTVIDEYINKNEVAKARALFDKTSCKNDISNFMCSSRLTDFFKLYLKNNDTEGYKNMYDTYCQNIDFYLCDKKQRESLN